MRATRLPRAFSTPPGVPREEALGFNKLFGPIFKPHIHQSWSKQQKKIKVNIPKDRFNLVLFVDGGCSANQPVHIQSSG